MDESGINKFYQREHARALRGIKVEDTKRGRKFERINVIGGLCNGKYIGIKCYKNTTNSIFFEDWFQNTLIPNLPENSTVIMDNASFHRKKILNEIAEKFNIKTLFLPPYSPDFNPIEKSWGNLKRNLCDSLKSFQTISDAVYSYFGVKEN